MSNWRDDLPPIPTERIRAEAIREGTRRRERRGRRQISLLVGGAGAVAVVLIVVSGVLTGTGDGRVDNASVATEVAADATTPSEETGAASAGTEAAAQTEAPAEDTTAATPASVTTAPSAASGTVPGHELSVVPAEIYEQLPGGPECGPSTFEVTFRPQSPSLEAPTVIWEINGVSSEAPMVIVEDTALATIGPFTPETLDQGVSDEVLIFVTKTDSSGAVEVFRGPTVLLHDCSP